MNRSQDKVDEQLDDNDLVLQKFIQDQKVQEQEKMKKLNEQRASMKQLTPEELKKLSPKERMAYKAKMKGIQEFKPQEKVMSEEDYIVLFLMENYGVSEQEAMNMIEQDRIMQDQQQQQKTTKALGGIQLGRKQKKPKDDQKVKKEPKLFQRLIKQLEGEQNKRVSKKIREEPKLEDIEIDETKFTAVDESKQPVNIVFIGHVDAGKSTICGNILYYSGMVDQQDIRKFKQDAKDKNRESWFLAYIMDINETERNKGITVEVGKAFFQTQNKRFTILDAPGHKNYVPDMIQGAAQADVACLVISSKVGEFEAGFQREGQTKEHSMLARCLGVKKLIVVINKMDDDKWNQKRYQQIQDQLNPFLKDNCGFDIKSDVSYVPISGLSGDNIANKVQTDVCEWYSGKSLFDELDNIDVSNRNENGGLRIPILDKYKDQGLFINGKIENGTLKTNQQVMIMPYRRLVDVTHIYNAEDNRVMYAKPGENIKIRVKGIEENDIMRGMVLVNPDSQCYVCNDIEVRLQVLELPDHKNILSAGYTCVMHLHTALEEVQITHVNLIWDETKQQMVSAGYLKSGTTGVVRLSSDNYICVDKFAVNEHMGGFSLRDGGKTIALGQIIRLKPVKEENIEELSQEMKQLLEAKRKEMIGKKEDKKQEVNQVSSLTIQEEEDQQF